MKSSNESLSSADTGYSIPSKLLRQPSPLPPPVPERQISQDIVDRAEVEVQTISIEPIKFEPTKVDASTITQRPKSVSFGDNEYLPLLSHNEEPEPSDDINQLFFDEYKRQNSQEDDDGYEIPIKYPHGPRARSQQTKPVKSILRSPSPSSASTTLKTTLSSLDRPLRTTRVPVGNTTVTTTAVVHTAILPSSDEEIEHENPFRKEFLEHRPYENIYEELNFEGPLSSSTKPKIEKDPPLNAEYSVAQKQRPKSSYLSDTSREYSEIPPIASQSNENLIETTNELIATQTTSQLTGNLDRPKQKPPLPPKPKSTTAPVVKHADIKQNEALKQFQQEMLRGDLYEFVHDTETNQITRIKQQTTNIVESKPKESLVDASNETTAKENRSFNQASPLPPIPKTNIPSYSKVYKRTQSVERPSVSPPPPPINLSTLPTADKLKSIHPNNESQIEIVPTHASSTSIDVSGHRVPEKCQENSSDYSLVTQETHREILLQENEIRNAMQHQEQQIITETVVSSSRIPVRKAPLPPTNEQKPKQMQQQYSQNACSPSFSSINNNNNSNNNNNQNQMHSMQQTTSSSSSTLASNAQIFPVTQILPVQYSNLPMPQQPDYFLTFPTPDQMNCNTISMPQSNAFSTFMVSDNNATQTANISSNIMSHDNNQQQQQHQISNTNIPSIPYMQQQQPSFITVPISTFQSMNHHHQQQPHFQRPNYVNMTHASPMPINMNTLSHINRPKYMFDVYRGNYNETLLQQQNYLYQTQPLLQCQQDTNSFNPQTHPLQSNEQVDNLSRDPGLNRKNEEYNNNPTVGTTSYSSLTIVDSQIHKRNEETHLTENFYDIPEGIEPTDESTINTIGKQTAV